jgi:hypothetical protein
LVEKWTGVVSKEIQKYRSSNIVSFYNFS